MLLQGQISRPFSIFIVITGSNKSPFLDLQCYYRVKSVSLFRFTMLLRGQISLPFWIMLLRGQFRFTMLLQGQIGHSFSIHKVFTG